MKRYCCLFGLLLFLPAGYTQAQSGALPDHFASWTATQTSLSGRPGDSASSIDAQRDALYQESGAEHEEYRVYASAKRQVPVFLTRFRDSSGAYELYTHGLQPGMKSWGAGELSAGDSDSVYVLEGNYVLTVRNPGSITVGEVNQLLTSLHPSRIPLPPIRGYLPEEELVNGTQRYALGPVAFRAAAEQLGQPEFGSLAEGLGFSKGAEAMFARYRPGALLILLDYPTPQLAELHLRHLEFSLPDAAKQGGATIERKGSLLSIVLAPAMPGYAETLRNNIKYETQLTWNEPSQTATDQPWSVILYHIFVGTALFMILAVICGVLFGGLRVFTKRLLPGKIFDRPKNIEILQLGLSGKRIDPSDFY